MKNQTKLIEQIFDEALKMYTRNEIVCGNFAVKAKMMNILKENNGQFNEAQMLRILTGTK